MTTESVTKVSSAKGAANDRKIQETFMTKLYDVRGALDDVRRSVPEVARASRAAVDDMVTAMEKSSNDRAQAGVTMSLGLAVGMLLGGAPRLFVLVALVPVAAMALALGSRRSKGGPASA